MYLYQGKKRTMLWILVASTLTLFLSVLAYVYFPRTGEAEIDVGPFSESREEDLFLSGVGAQNLGEPVRVLIPSLGIDSSIEKVGITASGKMAVPKSMYTVGWYRYGPRPGGFGTALFAGHVDNALGQDGVFARLESITQGDVVTVTDSGGKKVVFRVEEVRRVPYNFGETGKLFATDANTSRIVLITCGGRWIQSAKTYSERVVVTAVLTDESS